MNWLTITWLYLYLRWCGSYIYAYNVDFILWSQFYLTASSIFAFFRVRFLLNYNLCARLGSWKNPLLCVRVAGLPSASAMARIKQNSCTDAATIIIGKKSISDNFISLCHLSGTQFYTYTPLNFYGCSKDALFLIHTLIIYIWRYIQSRRISHAVVLWRRKTLLRIARDAERHQMRFSLSARRKAYDGLIIIFLSLRLVVCAICIAYPWATELCERVLE